MTRKPESPADYVGLPANRDRIARAIDDEMHSHLDERIAELTAAGMSRDAATSQALREFGNVDDARRDLRRIDERAARSAWISNLVGDLGSDIWRTMRSLARRPAFATVAISTLALGIGANAVMFGLIDRLLLSPPPHLRNADELVRLRFDVAQADGGRIQWIRASYPAFQLLAERATSLSEVAAYTDRPLSFATGRIAEEVRVLAVTASYFPTLGPRPAAGRFLNVGSDEAADARSVVISQALWARHFASAAAAVGQSIRLGGQPFTVIGVAPRGFTGDGIDPIDAWIPLTNGTPSVPRAWATNPNIRIVSIVARVRPGVRVEQAMAEATRLYRGALADAEAADSTARVLFRGLAPGRDADVGVTPETRVALWLQGVSVLVLLIAVANVTNLLLLRAIERNRETAVRLALGISRLRLVRHLALESAALAVVGGVMAVILARWAGPALWRVVLPAGVDVEASQMRIVTATAALALVAAAFMTLLPAVLQRVTRVGDVLRGARGGSRRTSSIGEALVVLQVSLTVVLLVGAGLFVRSLLRIQSVDLGFAVGNVVGVRVNTSGSGSNANTAAAMLVTARDAIQRVPGVTGVAVGQTAPFRPSLNVPVFLPGHDKLPGVGPERLGYPTFFAVTPEYFDVLGIRLLRGRGFTTADQRTSTPVMVVDATMARTFWPGGDALGQCVRLGADTMPCTTVVGVVGDTRRVVTEPTHSLRYFLPLEQSPVPGSDRYVFARTTRRAVSMESGIRAAVVTALASAPFVEVFPMERLLDWQTQQWRLGTAAFLCFGLLATLVATIGLYGVISFSVARRERELGIRRALGAPTVNLLGFVARGAMMRTVVGLGVGAVLAGLLAQRIRDLLFRPAAADASTFGIAAAIVLVATIVASVAPAWRATHADPMRALRSE